jgi:hypothetical protein
MKLCNSFLLASLAFINFKMSAEETPSASGVLRGNDVPVWATEENETTTSIRANFSFNMRI